MYRTIFQLNTKVFILESVQHSLKLPYTAYY